MEAMRRETLHYMIVISSHYSILRKSPIQKQTALALHPNAHPFGELHEAGGGWQEQNV